MTPLERVQQIPGIRAKQFKAVIEVTARDFLLRVGGTGKWHFLEHMSKPPIRPEHFTLRRLIHEALNG